VVRQALREKVKPTLFINKVDRLINELQVTTDQMQERFIKIILEVNSLINKMVPKEFKGEWKVAVEDGSVAFGSAYHNWAISAPYMKKSAISFKDIYNYLNEGNQKELAKRSPIHDIILDMVVHHLPSPVLAQKYRIPHIWQGELESKVGKAMVETSEDGPLTMMVTKIIIDPHAGEVATGRIFSGKVERGQTLTVVGMPGTNRIQQVGFFFGADREAIEVVSAGNIAAVTGLKSAIAGSTVSSQQDMEAFEKIVHVSEPVVTVAIEAKHMKDLPKLVEVLRQVAKADPSLEVSINQETGEHLLSGMGELHLEITEYRIINEKGVDIKSSQPIVVYRESVDKHSGRSFEGKSPNKHNRFYFVVEPLEEGVVKAIQVGEIQSGRKIKDSKAMAKQLQELGMEKDEARSIYYIHSTNMFINATKGIQYLHETKELLIDAFVEAMKAGPLSREPTMGIKVKLVDAKLHEDAIHRGPAQVIPAARSGIFGAMMWATTILREPKQKVFIDVPQELMGAANRELQSRRAEIMEMNQEGDQTRIVAKAPVSEMFGFASSIRSVTGGKALWNTEHAGFEKLPFEYLNKVVREIRTRKGLKPEPPTADYFAA